MPYLTEQYFDLQLFSRTFFFFNEKNLIPTRQCLMILNLQNENQYPLNQKFKIPWKYLTKIVEKCFRDCIS